MHLKTWDDVFRICFVTIVITFCAGVFMYVTASNPSADDFWRAMGMAGGGFISFMVGRKTGRSEDKQHVDLG